MITLTCTKCQTSLELDDAFAGGVCRCKECGAIQTVPSPAKDSTTKHRKPPGTPGKRRSTSVLHIAAILFMILIIAILLYWLGQH